MSVVQLNCPLCGGAFQVDSSLGGQNVTCPNCHDVVAIPELSSPFGHDFLPPSRGPPPAPGPMQLSCPVCSGLFQVTPDMAGVEVACPHCNNTVMIPALGNFGEPAPAGPEFAPPLEETPLEQFFPAGFGRGEKLASRGRFTWPDEPAEPDSTPGQGDEGPAVPQIFLPGESQLLSPPAPPQESEDVPLPPEYHPPLPPSEPAFFPPVTSRPGPPEPRARIGEGQAPPTISRRLGPSVDTLLPPGAGVGDADSLLPPGLDAGSAVDSILPPGASAETAAEDLLPPGAPPMGYVESHELPDSAPPLTPPLEHHAPLSDAPEGPPIKQPARKARRKPKTGPILIPTEEGYVEVQEPVKTIVKGGQEVELKQLTPEERAKRRRIRNVVLGGFCLLILFVSLLGLVYLRG